MYLIFDFDGTLIDSFLCIIDEFNLLATKFNFRQIKTTEIEQVRNLSSQELLKYLEIPIYKLPAILYLARKHLHKKMHLLNPCKDISTTLNRLIVAGFRLGIVTSNSQENVMAWLSQHDMDGWFDFVYASSSFFDKSSALRKAIKSECIEQNKTFYIGDETRDIVAAKECGIYSIAVTWGFNSQQVLANYFPDHFAHHPNDILSIGLNHLKKISS